jgi:GNAT superfamily N-acetyltransferase
MDRAEVLAVYDREMRIEPPTDAGVRLERAGPVVRIVGPYLCVIYSHLDPIRAVEEVAAETQHLRGLGQEVEWKVYGHDVPAELGSLLRSAGYVPDAPETLVVRELSDAIEPGPVPTGLQIRRVTSESDLALAVDLSRGAFGPDKGWPGAELGPRLSDARLAIFLAYVDGKAVASGRLEMPAGRSFASLWGGGTLPEYRGRGIYRALVARRAEVARQAGYRFLTVDARESSRPILERLGFEPLTSITGWVLRPASKTVSREPAGSVPTGNPSRA